MSMLVSPDGSTSHETFEMLSTRESLEMSSITNEENSYSYSDLFTDCIYPRTSTPVQEY